MINVQRKREETFVVFVMYIYRQRSINRGKLGKKEIVIITGYNLLEIKIIRRLQHEYEFVLIDEHVDRSSIVI